jgi:acetoacetyl-CoA synthetase
VSGRSDATLNRDGIRIGTAEIYGVLDKIDFISDSLIVCIEKTDGSFYMPLFIVMKEGVFLSDDKKQLINSTLRSTYSPRHVPDAIYSVQDIPYTISGKKLEIPVKRILMGWPLDKAASIDSIRNPEALKGFQNFILDK